MAHLGTSSRPEEVLRLLEHPELEEMHLLDTLRNRNLPASILETIARHERWSGRHSVRTAIVNHPKTPRTLALRLLQLLYWRELLKVSANYRVAVPIRLAAETRLRERLPDLELGERISLARSAPPGLVPLLALDPSARVIAALLMNPRMKEAVVISLADRHETPSEVLRVVAQNERWASRWAVKKALLKNARTPVHAALRLLRTLPKEKIRELVARGELPLILNKGAERILAGQRLGRTPLR